MKLEVGMYCYNKVNRKVGIGKITSFQNNNNLLISYKNDTELVSIGNVIASYDIMDLIEVGDILSYKHSAINKIYKEVVNNKVTLEIFRKYFNEKSLELISVVTHEQFENMEYRIGE